MTTAPVAGFHPGPRVVALAGRLDARATLERRGAAVLGLPLAAGGSLVWPSANETAQCFLVMSWIGTHPDAADPLLADLWRIEEAARATGRPVLVLRFAPVIGEQSPLVARLAARPPLAARISRGLVQPIHEADAAAGLARVLAGECEWRGWYEVCGPTAVSLAELSAAAASGVLGHSTAKAAWEPSPAILRAMGLSEWEPWAEFCGVAPRPLALGVIA